MKKSLTDVFTMSNGLGIPSVGFGTWQTPDGETCINSVKAAIEAGYRHIDTAYVYRNEAGVGQGIIESGIKREDLFLTSKLWNKYRGYDSTLKYFERSLELLKTDYLDLYLIHWPANELQFGDEAKKINADTWKAFERLYEEGVIKSIGLSNFLKNHLEALEVTANIKPMIDQIEYHPGYTQPETVSYCKQNGIVVEAWSPLGTGKMLENETIKGIAEKYGVSAAQLLINWCLSEDILPLPKSVTPSRIRENADVFSFEISKEDSDALFALPYIGGSGLHPDKVDF